MPKCTTIIIILLVTLTACAQEITDTRNKLLNLQCETTLNGGSGLIYTQTVPTNPMGSLGISMHGLFLQHTVRGGGVENLGTGMIGLTYSVTRDIEAYFSSSYVAGMRASSPSGTFISPRLGIGSQEMGAKVRFPLRRAGLFEAGGTVGFVLGTARYKVPGFNYLNTRRDNDIKLRLVQSLRFQDRWGGPNLHLNEGYITEHGPAPDLFQFGVGADYLLQRRWQFIAEFNSFIEQRTPIYLNENFMAMTGAVRFFAPSGISLDVGANIGLSKDRLTDASWQRSDPWQVFAGITFTPKVNTADRDVDGIPDWLDAEMNLPPDYPKDAFGQLLDTDQDGIPDALDKETTSQRGAVVDKDGVALDTDGDGVPNGLDREPRTPPGAWVDAMGIAYDTDRDGIPDGLDKEPNTIIGALVDTEGMARDGDQDGVPDGIDQEANTPAGSLVDAYGRGVKDQMYGGTRMAGMESAERLEASLMKLPNLHFDVGSSRIKAEDYSTLDVVGGILTDYPMLVVLIEGHADTTGSVQRNLDLSYARARAVRDYLLQKFPKLTRANFTVTGLGEQDPLADDAQTEGRIQNRRVEFKILNRQKVQEMITTWE